MTDVWSVVLEELVGRAFRYGHTTLEIRAVSGQKVTVYDRFTGQVTEMSAGRLRFWLAQAREVKG